MIMEGANMLKNGEKPTRQLIYNLIDTQIEKAHKLLAYGIPSQEVRGMFFEIMQRDEKLTDTIMTEAHARLRGEEAWIIDKYVKGGLKR